jgi:hypothetical protein
MTAANRRADRKGERYAIRLTTHSGLLLVGRSRWHNVQGSYDECVDAYRRSQTHNLLLGWWGIASLAFFNWVALVNNRRALSALRTLANVPG